LWSWLRREEENSTNQPKTRVNMTSAPWWSPASTLRTPHESSGALVSTTESFDRVSLSHLILVRIRWLSSFLSHGRLGWALRAE
jgi:hypothetical protein